MSTVANYNTRIHRGSLVPPKTLRGSFPTTPFPLPHGFTYLGFLQIVHTLSPPIPSLELFGLLLLGWFQNLNFGPLAQASATSVFFKYFLFV
ncbi:hypothetical protein RJT34_01465 [Clitoria ternatea]|uniref:Uncharacterized protein n=1 Tax=Clitoria ternatea TaxID=43366 RepID=A0AAN9KJJ4_CLITE